MLTGLSLLATYVSSLIDWPSRGGAASEPEAEAPTADV